MENSITIGVVGATRTLFEECRYALDGFASLQPRHSYELVGRDLTAALVSLTGSDTSCVALYARCRNAHATLPLILLGEELSANLAVELVKCGADDYLDVPFDRAALLRKVRRAVDGFRGPAFDDPAFVPLQPAGFTGRNRRHCFRIAVSAEFPVHARLRGTSGEYPVRVVDVSIANDGWFGGMLLKIDEAVATNLDLSDGQKLRILAELPDSLPPMPLDARIVLGGVRAGPRKTVMVALQYQTACPEDEERMRQYWVDAQRRGLFTDTEIPARSSLSPASKRGRS